MTGLACQQFQNSYLNGHYYPLSPTDGTALNVTDLERTISVSLGNYNLNGIKALVGLCRVPKDCFLSGYFPFVNDTRGNPVSLQLFSIYLGLMVSTYVPDTLPPTLLYWDFNFKAGQIQITFSETVYVAFFNYSGVIISSQANLSQSQFSMRVTNSSSAITDWSTLPPNSDTVNVILSTTQLDYIKSRNVLLRTLNNSFLILDYDVVRDTSNAMNRFQGINPSKGVQVRDIIYSTAAPECSSFKIDLTSQTIVLIFSEVMDITSIVLDQLLLQSNAVSNSYTDTLHLSASYVNVNNTFDSNSIVLTLLPAAFNIIKASTYLAKNPTSTYVSFTSSFIKDIFGNRVIAISTSHALMASSYIADFVSPFLESWSINMGIDILYLTFSEPLEFQKLNLSKLILSSQNSNSTTSVVSYSLGSDSYIASYQLNQATIQMGPSTANSIKAVPPLCIAREFCYLSVEPGFGYDTPTVTSSGFLQQNSFDSVFFVTASSFVSDSIPPSLVSYTFNLNNGAMNLVFSETVNSLSLNSTGIVFYDSGSGGIPVHCSEYVYFTPVYSDSLMIYIPPVTFLQIKSNLKIFTSNLFASFNGTIQDMAGNMLLPVSQLQASAVVADVTPPSLIALSWNATTYLLSAYFNDAILTSNVNQGGVQVYSSSPGQSAGLSSAILLTTGTFSTLLFDLSPLSSVLSAIDFGSSQFSTNIYLSGSGDVHDASSNQNPNAAMSASQAIVDGNGIYNFRVDLNSFTLIFEFYFAVNVERLDPTQVVLRDSSILDIYSFTGYTAYSISQDGLFLELVLTTFDYDAMQNAVSFSNTNALTATIGRSFITEADGKNLAKIQSIPCVQIKYSTKPPAISSYFIDLSTSLMTIFFTKPVYVEKAYTSALSLTSGTNAAQYSSVNLAQAMIVVSSNISQTIVLALGNGSYPTIVDRIYLTGTVCKSILSTYLISTYGFVYDTAIPHNYMAAISSTSAVQALFVTQDSGSPSLLSFNLDMEIRQMILVFTKAVNGSTGNVKSITLHQKADAPLSPKSASYTLTDSITFGLGPRVFVNISHQDFNALLLLAPNLATSKSNTYITLQSYAYTDITYRKNPVSIILNQYAMQVTNYVADTNPPQLLYYDVSLQSAELDFYFNEVVNCSTFQVSFIHLQYRQFLGSQPYQLTLTNDSIVFCPTLITSVIRVFIGKNDLFQIQFIPYVLKSYNQTYLTLPGAFVKDPYNNVFQPIFDSFAIQPRYYTGDTIPPALEYIFVSNIKILTLVFNKPIDLSYPFDASKIVFYDGQRSYNFSYNLTASSRLIEVGARNEAFKINFQLDYLVIQKTTGTV